MSSGYRVNLLSTLWSHVNITFIKMFYFLDESCQCNRTVARLMIMSFQHDGHWHFYPKIYLVLLAFSNCEGAARSHCPHNPAVITISNTKCTNVNHLTWTIYLSCSQYACPPYCTNKWKRQMIKHTGWGWARDFKSVAADQMKRQNNRITRTNNRISDAEWHFLLNWFMSFVVCKRFIHTHTHT